jgi:replicative DNA helicase
MKNQSHKSKEEGFVRLSSVLDMYLQGHRSDALRAMKTPLQSGYSDFDSLLGGMQRSDLIVIGAETGLGKSSLALNICANVARFGLVCGVVSFELDRSHVGMRMLVAESGVDSHRLRLGLLSENEQNVISDAVGLLSGRPIFIDDTPFQTIMEMWSKAQRLQMEHGLDLLVVDCLQLIQSGERNRGISENRVHELGYICHVLKAIARDLNVAVLTCSQLSRAVGNRPDRRPHMTDLRDSGNLEELADVVVLLHREDRNLTEEEWDAEVPGRPYPRNLVEVIVAKHRYGPTGSFHLYFRDNLMRFDELARYEESVA